MTDTTTVRPGQIWADNDWRSAGRHVKVVEICGPRARVVRCGWDGDVLNPPRYTSIRLDRFRPTSTGYRLVGEVSA